MQTEMDNIITTYILTKFEDAKSGFCINLYRDESSGKSITCKGNFLPHIPRIRYSMQGYWKDAGRYGMNFVVENYSEILETTKEGIITYLSSGMISGIGKSTAERIYLRFGEDSLKVIEQNPEKLLGIKGISERKLEKIKKSYQERHLYRAVIEFLLPFGITPRQTVKVMTELNIHSVAEIKMNPYRLHNIHGISVQCIDVIAQKCGFPMDSMERFKAHALHVLLQNESHGHTAEEANRFGLDLIRSLHSEAFHTGNICDYTIRLIKEGYLKHCKVERHGNSVTLIARTKTYNAEIQTAEHLYNINAQKQPPHNDAQAWVEKNCEKDGIKLDQDQMKAVLTIIKSSFVIVTGSPGTGKTTIIKQAAKYLEANEKDRELYFMAPSGRAARRIKESTGFPGRTIHSSLGLLVSDSHEMSQGEEITIENATVFCDEVSMVGIFLMAVLTDRIKPGCRLILIGDENQLPSVECGSVLRDIIASEKVPVIRLTNIHRQAKRSNIYINSKKIETGSAALSTGDDFSIIRCDTSAEVQEKMIDHYIAHVKQFGMEHIYCIVPRKDGNAGVKAMNLALQDRVNPLKDGMPEFKIRGLNLRLGDPVMQLKNREDVANGDIGYVTRIYVTENEGLIAEVTYFNDTIIRYTTERAEEITLAYAFTVHKAQGSENKVVLTYLSKECGKNMLKRNLLYTAVSRGKMLDELFVLNDSALEEATLNDDRALRITTLTFQMIKIFGGWLPIQ